MDYQVLYFNDDGSAKVRMTINGHVLEQDFLTDNLDTDVKQGMAVFKAELDKNTPPVVDETLIGQVVSVSALPEA